MRRKIASRLGKIREENLRNQEDSDDTDNDDDEFTDDALLDEVFHLTWFRLSNACPCLHLRIQSVLSRCRSLMVFGREIHADLLIENKT